MTEDANQLESLDYGKAYIRAFNDAVATQDPSYAFSTDSYYGGLWDKYGIDLQLYKESVILYPDKYFVNQVMIDAGAAGALMSGSGSAVFGIFTDGDNAEKCAASFRAGCGSGLLKQVFTAKMVRAREEER